jgi:putative transposase
MARLARFFVAGETLHLIQRGNNRQAIFLADEDYAFYLECLEDAAHQQGLLIHAYVLMTNHVHLLATPGAAEATGKCLQSLGRRYVQQFNQRHARSGTLWEGRYKATLIDSERYLLTCMRYIELNPVRAGMVAVPEDYPWCSHGVNAGGAGGRLITPHPLYLQLGRDGIERQSAYRQLFQNDLAREEIDSIRASTNKAWALGDEGFRERMERLSNRRAAPRQKGRPKKRGKD